MTYVLNFMQKFIFNYWLVILFCLFTATLYEQQRKKIDLEYEKLHGQLVRVQKIKEEKLQQKEDLLLKINSQSDPDFVELLLKKELGVIADGETKIFFIN